MDALQRDYPWTKSPLIAGAPMRVISLASFATEISKAGGLGFIGAGNDVSNLSSLLDEAKDQLANNANLGQAKDTLPIGVGFLLWAGDKLLKQTLLILEKYRPAAVWFFAPNNNSDLIKWTQETRRVTGGKTKIWIQIGSVANAIEVTKTCSPDVLVVQGHDAGGHGLQKAAGILPLFPEVDDAISHLCSHHNMKKPVLVACGGISDPRTAAAALTLGASGIVMGTRYLASHEVNLSNGYRDAVLTTADGGQTTERTKLYDQLRGTTDWPQEYGGRGVLNQSYYDHVGGMGREENKRLYDEALKRGGDEGWGVKGRMTTYAGTGVGLAKEVKGVGPITEEVREGARRILRGAMSKL